MSKHFADLLTGLRALVAVGLILLGLQANQQSIPLAFFLMMVSWVSDYLDGRLASLYSGEHSWLGDHDLFIDISAAVGLLLYLVGVQFIPVIGGIGYVLLWVLLLMRFGISKTTGSTFQALIYGYFLWLVAFRAPQGIWWLAGWFALILIFDRQRFWHHVVPEFLHGLVDTFFRRKRTL